MRTPGHGCRAWFDEQRIAEQPHQRSAIRQREQPIGPAVRTRIPSLQQRTTRAQHEERRPDGDREQPQDPQSWVLATDGSPARGRQDRQHRQAQQQHRDVDEHLSRGPHVAHEQMRIQVAEHQHDLKEQDDDRPDRSRTAEPRKNQPPHDRLNLKQQERGHENRNAVERGCPLLRGACDPRAEPSAP